MIEPQIKMTRAVGEKRIGVISMGQGLRITVAKNGGFRQCSLGSIAQNRRWHLR